MTTQNLALFEAMGAKMDYLNRRQRLISQNISNADTPGYKPQDLTKADFSGVLKDVLKSKGGAKNVHLDRTRASHITSPGDARAAKAGKVKQTYEVAPAGNAVIIEEQLINSGQVVMDYNMMLNLMQKNTGLIKTAIGRGQ